MSFQVSSVAPSQSLTASQWNLVLRREVERLPNQQIRTRLERLNFETFNSAIQDLSQKHSTRRDSRVITAITPTIQVLKSLTGAISTYVQFDAIPAFMWGSIQMVLECADKYSDCLSKMTDMLNELSRTLPQFEDYMDLYPHSLKLEGLLRDLYQDYIDFCIQSFRFLSNKPFWTLVKMLWSKVQLQFTRTKSNIDQHKREFLEETRLLNSKINLSTACVSNEIRDALPHIYMAPKNTFPVFEVPYSQNKSFTGRDSALSSLRATLEGKSTFQLTSCVLHGIGGVGKTQLAMEYAYRYRHLYDMVFWLRGETNFDLAKTYGSIARCLGLAHDLDDQSKNIELVRDWLNQTDKNWLLIFDNVDSADNLETYWAPSTRSGSIIITSQNRALAKDFSITSEISLEALVPNDGASFLMRCLKLPENERPIAQKISKLVTGLPLALAHIIGYVDGNCTLEEFHDEFLQKEATFELWGAGTGSSLSQYPKNLLTVFAIALGALSTNARHLIDIFSMLNPDSIPEEMLLLSSKIPYLKQKSEYIDTKRNLRSRHLVETEVAGKECYFNMHRSLQQHLLFYLRIDSTKRDVVFLETLELVSKTFPRQSPWQSPVNEKWDRYEKYIPHVWTLWSHFIHSSPPIVGTVELATVLCDAGNYFWERGLGQNGLLMLRTANQICESLSKESLGSIHADTLTLIACLLVDAGLSQRLEGKSSFERVLGLRTQKFLSTPLEEVSEVDTLLFANGFNDFGCALIHSEMYSEAEGHFLRALNIKKSVGDERSHPVEFAEAYKNLAIVRLAEGNSSVAISLMTQALKLVKSEYDENTAIIQQNRFHLAAILCNSGQYDEALEESLSILRIRVELFGEKGLPTLNSFYALGMMYYLLGKYGLAEEALTASLASLDISRWQPECITRAKYLLSQVLFRLNKTQEAAALEKEARVSLEKFLSAYAPLLHAAWHSGTITDELMLYDHLVSIHCGRYTIGKLAKCCEKP